MMAARALDDIFGSAHDPKRAMVLRCCNAQDCSDIGANPSDIGANFLLWCCPCTAAVWQSQVTLCGDILFVRFTDFRPLQHIELHAA